MDYAKNVTERISAFLNQPLIVYLKNDVSYKGIFRGIGNQRNLVFDLTEKTVKIIIENHSIIFHREPLKCTEYINPNDVVTFVPDFKRSSNNALPSHAKFRPQYIYIEPEARILRDGIITKHPLPNSFAQPQCGLVVDLSQQQLVDMNGQLVNMNGQLINMNGPLVNTNGQIADMNGQRGPAWFFPYGLPLSMYAPTQNLPHDQPLQPQLFKGPQQPDFVNIQPVQVPVPKLVHQQVTEEPNEVGNQATNSLAYRSNCQQAAVVTGKVLYEQACSLFGSPSVSVNHDQQYENSFNAYGQQSFNVNNRSNRYELPSQLVNQHPCYADIQENQTYVPRVSASPSILHKYSIAQLMAGVVPNAENFRNEYFQDLLEQSEREFQFEAVLDFQVEGVPDSTFEPPFTFSAPRNETKPPKNKSKSLETNNKPNAFSYYLPIDLGLNTNSNDNDELAKNTPQTIEKQRRLFVTKISDRKMYKNQNEPKKDTNYSGANVSNNYVAPTVEPKYRILHRNHHQYHKSILPGTLNNSNAPSTSSDTDDFNNMNPKQFDMHLMKSLGSEHASIINMTREEFVQFLKDSPNIKKVERPSQASEKPSRCLGDATLLEKPTNAEKLSETSCETEPSPSRDYSPDMSPDTFDNIENSTDIVDSDNSNVFQF